MNANTHPANSSTGENRHLHGAVGFPFRGSRGSDGKIEVAIAGASLQLVPNKNKNNTQIINLT